MQSLPTEAAVATRLVSDKAFAEDLEGRQPRLAVAEKPGLCLSPIFPGPAASLIHNFPTSCEGPTYTFAHGLGTISKSHCSTRARATASNTGASRSNGTERRLLKGSESYEVCIAWQYMQVKKNI